MDISFNPAEIAIIGALLGALVAAVGVLWRSQLVVQSKLTQSLEDRLKAVIADRDAYRDIAEEAMNYLDAVRNRARGRRAEADFQFIPRDRALHQSLSSRRQDEDAETSTLRKRLSAARDDLERLSDLDYQSKSDVEEPTVDIP